MENTTGVKLKFSCKQHWDEMKPTAKGRFCISCQHEVQDLTNKTFQEINALKAQNGKLCGLLRTEQVEPELTPIEFRWINSMKYAAATIITFLGLELSSAKAQDKKEIKTENTGTTVDKMGDPVCPVGGEKEALEVKPYMPAKTRSYRPAKPIMANDRYSWYWSKRFPFVVKRSNRMMGFM